MNINLTLYKNKSDFLFINIKEKKFKESTGIQTLERIENEGNRVGEKREDRNGMMKEQEREKGQWQMQPFLQPKVYIINQWIFFKKKKRQNVGIFYF